MIVICGVKKTIVNNVCNVKIRQAKTAVNDDTNELWYFTG